MKTKLLTIFLVLAILAVGVCAGGFVREKRINNLVVFKPRLFGTVSAVDGTEITLDAAVWGSRYERLEQQGRTITFDCRSVIYPDGNRFQDGISVGENVFLVVDGHPHGNDKIEFDHIYFCVEIQQ